MRWVVLWLAVLVASGIYLTWTAGRVDRLHARVEAARAVLDAQLLRRSGTALELATSGLLDPASALLVADAAHQARAVGDEGREQAESDLSQALSAALPDAAYVATLRADAASTALLDELAGACRRAAHARRFHNDAVRAARRLRRKRVVRWLRLAGRAPWPETVELDDSVPTGLGG